MNRLKDKVRSALEQSGFHAQVGRPWEKGRPIEKEKLCISVCRAEAKQKTVSGYLGTDEKGRERFSVELEVELGLTVLSPREKGGDSCERYAEMVFDRLLAGVEGFPVEALQLGESVYDSFRDCYTAELRAVSRAAAYGIREDSGVSIEDIRLRGAMQG